MVVCLLLAYPPAAQTAELNPYEAGAKAFRNRDWRLAVNRYGEAISMNLRPYEAHAGRGDALRYLKEYRAALADYEAAIRLKPRDPIPVSAGARTRQEMHDYAGAVREYQRAINLDKTNAVFHNNLAWILATCPDAAVRDGRRALTEAQESVRLTQGNRAYHLDTLAAACAECGLFDEAIQHEGDAIARVRQPGQDVSHHGHEFGARLKLYRNHQPLRVEL